MNEKMIGAWLWIEANLRILIWVVFGVLLLAILGIKGMEGTGSSAESDAAPPPPVPNIDVSQPDPAALTVRQEIEQERKPIAGSAFVPLILNNMFDVKAVRDAIEKDREANAKYQEALAFSQQKDYVQALQRVNETLAVKANHFRARQLKEELEKKLEGSGIPRPRS